MTATYPPPFDLFDLCESLKMITKNGKLHACYFLLQSMFIFTI